MANKKKNQKQLKDFVRMHDNTHPHAVQSTEDFFLKDKRKLFHQYPFSPDFNLCDRWVFKKMKQDMRKKLFSSKEEVAKDAVQ